jgi:hypothetical protein
VNSRAAWACAFQKTATFSIPPSADPAEDARREAEHNEACPRIGQILRDKGFGIDGDELMSVQIIRVAAILLFNAPECWEAPAGRQTDHDAVRLHEGVLCQGRMGRRRPVPQPKQRRAIVLRGPHQCR